MLLKFRQELPQISRKIDEIQCEVKLIDSDNIEEADQERGERVRDFLKRVLFFMLRIIRNTNLVKLNNSLLHNVSKSTAISTQRVYLASISLSKFDGNILEYFDWFKVLVYKKDMYSRVQNFSYTQSSLSGQVLDFFKSMPRPKANYLITINYGSDSTTRVW